MSLSFYETPNTEQSDPSDEVLLGEALEEPLAEHLEEPAEYKVSAVTPTFPLERSEPKVSDDIRSSHEDVRNMLFAINPVNRAKGLLGVVSSQAKRNRALGNQRTSDVVQESTRESKIVTLPYNGHEHLFVVTQPDPETIDKIEDAKIAWFKPGLSEVADAGSAKRLHDEHARRNPNQLVISEATKGFSHSGKTATLYDLADRNIETMASESLYFVRHFSGDGERETELYGVSLGTFSEAHMLAINIAANPKDQQNIKTAYLIASSLIACEVDHSEDFRDPSVIETDYRKMLKSRFRNHLVPDLLQMAVNNPGDIIASRDNAGAFLFAPEKTFPRLLSIKKDFEGVGRGLPWSMIKEIVRGADLKIFGGAEDPLIQEQIPQWIKINELIKRPGLPERDAVVQRTIRKYGHLVSADVKRTLDEIEILQTQTHSSIV